MSQATDELAHIARNLLVRLEETDPNLPGSIQQAISSKIDYYAGAE